VPGGVTTERGVPPGVHLRAVARKANGDPCQLRILGDDDRGYLLAGTLAIPLAEEEDIWFRTLDEAYTEGERLGVARESWTQIEAVSDVGQP
jgi:hypothetical protein